MRCEQKENLARVQAWLDSGGDVNDNNDSFLAMQGDNGIVWNILSYWRATN